MTFGRIAFSLWQWLIGESSHHRSISEFAPKSYLQETSEGGHVISSAKLNAAAEFNRKARALSVAFDAIHPVARQPDLHGRDEQLEMLFETVLQNGSHAVIHGQRGSGKTSLARMFGYHADRKNAVVIYSAAESSANFAELFGTLVEQLPTSCVRHFDWEEWRRLNSLLKENFRPRPLVELLSQVSPANQVIYILDEFDRIIDSKVLELSLIHI